MLAAAAVWCAAAGAAPKKWVSFTVASANLSDNDTQAYGGAGIRMLQALDPDVIGIQEFNYKEGTTADLVRRMFPLGDRVSSFSANE